MATMEGARGTKTKLRLGTVEAEVKLYSTVSKAATLADFDTAGPNGGELRTRVQAAPTPVEEQEKGTPLAVGADPGSDAPSPEEESAAAPTVPGEFATVLIEEGSGEVVAPDEIRRGIRHEGGEFLDLTEQIHDIEERTQLDRLEVIATIDVGQVPRERVTGSYFLAATDEDGPRVLRALYEGMRKARRACLVKWTKSTRQACGVIAADGRTGALLVLQVAWAEDFRTPSGPGLAHQRAAITEPEVDATVELLRALGDSRAVLDELRDDAVALREELREKAEAGEVETFVMTPTVESEPTADLASQLAESVEAVKAA